MSPTLALLVVVWAGHDFPPVTLPSVECQRAIEAISVAGRVREQKYDFDTITSVSCIPLDTAADGIVSELLAPPPPSPKQNPVPVKQPTNRPD